MKRWFIVFLTVLVLFSVSAFGQDTSDGSQSETKQEVEDNLQDIGMGELLRETPEQAQKLLEEMNIRDYSFTELLTLTPSAFLKVLWNTLQQEITKPLKTFCVVLGIVLLCAILNGMKNMFLSDTLTGVFSVISVLCIVTFISDPIIDCIVSTCQGLRDCANFILSFIPVFTGIVTTSGHPVTAGMYSLFLFSACQVVAQLAATILVPLISIYFALSLVGSVAPQLNISVITGGIKKIVCWSLGLLTTLFVGLLSIQTLVSTSADSVTVKTSKFLIGSFVPVIGGALSDAFLAAQGCLRLMKTTVGAAGIVIASFTFLPILIKVIVWHLIVTITSEIANMVGAGEISKVLKSAGTTLSILIALILCFALLIIVSTTVVMIMGGV